MTSSTKWFLVLGGLNAAAAVALGAAGTHLLKAQLAVSDPSGWFAVALQYHQYHALGLILVGLATIRFPSSKWFVRAGLLMLLGTLLFCGNLYWLSLTGSTPWHAAIPVGGVALITAWLLFSIGGIRLSIPVT
ncbi:MAG: DUF423 domain-containing protein [Propionivibrio sp.]